MLAPDAGRDGFSCGVSSDCGTLPGAVCVNEVCTTDLEMPVLAVDAPASGATVGLQLTITGTASDAISGVGSVEYSFDGAAWAPLPTSGNAFAQRVAGPAGTEPTSTLAVRATDRAGNSTAVSIPVNVDRFPPNLTMDLGADYNCSGAERCTGAVINLANSNGGASFAFGGTLDDASAGLTIKIGGQPEVEVKAASGKWMYAWAPVAGDGEVVVVVKATDPAGNATSIVRKVWVDLAAPICKFAVQNNARRVDRAGALLSCSEAMALSSVSNALRINNAAPPAGFYADANNAFFYSGSAVLDGNTTVPLAFGAGATDKAGNAAAALDPIRFRTRPVLPAGETVVSTTLSGLDYPRMAVDVDGLPYLFAWDGAGAGAKQARLFTWNGLGDETTSGAWREVPMKTPSGQVRDFRIGQGVDLNGDLSLKHTGRVVMSQELSGSRTVASVGESIDNLASFSELNLPNGIDPKSQPSFYAGLIASPAASGVAGWSIIEDAAAERVVIANADAAQVQLWKRNNNAWAQDSAFTGIGVQVASMHQAGFMGYPCQSPSDCQNTPKVWHVSASDLGVSPFLVGKVAAAGIASLPHTAPAGTVAPVYVAWSEHPAGSSTAVTVTVACRNTLPSAGTWLTSGRLSPLDPSATEIAGIDFGQGVNKIAIAVDTASTGAEDNSQFGLLPGDACGSATTVDWGGGGGLVSGRNPTTAFSNEGVLWRSLARGTALRVLAPIKVN